MWLDVPRCCFGRTIRSPWQRDPIEPILNSSPQPLDTLLTLSETSAAAGNDDGTALDGEQVLNGESRLLERRHCDVGDCQDSRFEAESLQCAFVSQAVSLNSLRWIEMKEEEKERWKNGEISTDRSS